MTTLVAWLSIDGKGNASALNIASDSRITWSDGIGRWDSGRKIYWSRRRSHIFGCSGDVVAMGTTLSQLCDLIDYSILDSEDQGIDEVHQQFKELIKSSYSNQVNVEKQPISFFHGTRVENDECIEFILWKTSFDHKSCRWFDNKWKPHSITGRYLEVAGSGEERFYSKLHDNRKLHGEGVKSIFYSLFETSNTIGEKGSGGPLQMIRLLTSGQPVPVGFVIEDDVSFMGMPIESEIKKGNIEWLNENYQTLRGPKAAILSGTKQNVYRNTSNIRKK